MYNKCPADCFLKILWLVTVTKTVGISKKVVTAEEEENWRQGRGHPGRSCVGQGWVSGQGAGRNRPPRNLRGTGCLAPPPCWRSRGCLCPSLRFPSLKTNQVPGGTQSAPGGAGSPKRRGARRKGHQCPWEGVKGDRGGRGREPGLGGLGRPRQEGSQAWGGPRASTGRAGPATSRAAEVPPQSREVPPLKTRPLTPRPSLHSHAPLPVPPPASSFPRLFQHSPWKRRPRPVHWIPVREWAPQAVHSGPILRAAPRRWRPQPRPPCSRRARSSLDPAHSPSPEAAPPPRLRHGRPVLSGGTAPCTAWSCSSAPPTRRPRPRRAPPLSAPPLGPRRRRRPLGARAERIAAGGRAAGRLRAGRWPPRLHFLSSPGARSRPPRPAPPCGAEGAGAAGSLGSRARGRRPPSPAFCSRAQLQAGPWGGRGASPGLGGIEGRRRGRALAAEGAGPPCPPRPLGRRPGRAARAREFPVRPRRRPHCLARGRLQRPQLWKQLQQLRCSARRLPVPGPVLSAGCRGAAARPQR